MPSYSSLAILICHKPERTEWLGRLTAEIKRQIITGRFSDSVSIHIDDSVGITTGAKRNKLLTQTTSDYIVFIDDDDWIHSAYVALVMERLLCRPFVVGLSGWYLPVKPSVRCGIKDSTVASSILFEHSLMYDSWGFCQGKYYRTPNHLNPIRSDIARTIGYKDITVGEDKDYSDRLYVYLKDAKAPVCDIRIPLYYYLANRIDGIDYSPYIGYDINV